MLEVSSMSRLSFPKNMVLENSDETFKNGKSRKKLATYGMQDEEKQNKNTTQYVLDTTMHKQTYCFMRES
jgi:hypothetical protein